MNRSNTRLLLAATFILLAAALMILNLSGFLSPVQGLVLRPLSAVQTWIALRFSAVRDVLTSPSDVASLREQINFLEAENARLQQEIISLQEQAAEAEVLAALLNYARAQPESRYVAANVIGRDISPFLRSIIIGRGTDQGIARGMPVVTARGLVGRVVEVFPSTARVQLITDPETAVNVQFQDTRTEGTLTAQLNGDLIVDLIDLNAELNLGELVLTSGLGGKYPDNIPVGQVSNIRRRDYDLFQQATIQSSIDFNDLDIVLVITNFQPFELE
jgi:rod shape-determining protein MreC